MGMHFGLVAVKTDVAQLMEAFPIAWPKHEFKTRGEVAGLAALGSWIATNARFVSAATWTPDNPGTEAYGFWQDGEWAILLDPDFVQAGDLKGLAALGERFGCALSFVIETASATAMFWRVDGGHVARHIRFESGEMHVEGERLPQEEGLPSDVFYMTEMEDLQRAFGITPLEQLPADKPLTGAAYVDRTDYAPIKQARQAGAADAAKAPPSVTPARRPWWKFR